MLPCESEYQQLGGTDDDEEAADVDVLEQADWVNTFFSTAPLPEEVTPSQLGGNPPATQDSTQGEQTLVPDQTHHSTHVAIPLEPLTYSQHHTRAAQAAERRGRRKGQARTHLVYRLLLVNYFLPSD